MHFNRRVGIGMIVLALSTVTFAEDGKAKKPSKADQQIQRLTKQVDGQKNIDDKVKAFVKEKLLPMCTNEVFVKAVTAQNAKKVSLKEIKKTDQKWVDAEDELPIQKELMNNDCAKEIKKIAKANPAISESFVMDNQGANVGQNVLTSDYWQGDEAKWQKAYANGKGAVLFSDAKLDRSTNTVDQKISLPIIDKDGKVIGAVCVGIKPKEVK